MRLDSIDENIENSFSSELAKYGIEPMEISSYLGGNGNVGIDTSIGSSNVDIGLPSVPQIDFNFPAPNYQTYSTHNQGGSIGVARSMVGKRYKWGARVDDNTGADCSSLTSKAAKAVGVNLPRTAYSQYLWFKKRGRLTNDINSAKPGDMVYFNFTNRNKNPIGHTAIISEVKDGKIKVIEASGSKGKVVERWLPANYYKRIAGIGKMS